MTNIHSLLKSIYKKKSSYAKCVQKSRWLYLDANLPCKPRIKVVNCTLLPSNMSCTSIF
jgi:hypothetical protein